jgi:hypothetical protein
VSAFACECRARAAIDRGNALALFPRFALGDEARSSGAA